MIDKQATLLYYRKTSTRLIVVDLNNSWSHRNYNGRLMKLFGI